MSSFYSAGFADIFLYDIFYMKYKMKKLRLIFLVLLLPSLLFPQKMDDNYKYSLDVVYGEQNYAGEKDSKASCRITSNGNRIIINIEVFDDKLIFNNSIYSDHIELWFGYDDLSYYYDDHYSDKSNKYAYIGGKNKYLYQYQNKPYLKSVIEEMKNPYIHDDSGIRDSKNYNQLKTDNYSDDWYIKGEVDSWLLTPRFDSLYKTYVFFGVTHFGINPETGHVTFYDRENYDYFKKYLGIEIGELNKFITARITLTERRYRAKIVVKPEALGFINVNGVSEIKFMADIVDCDTEGKQSSILSTSQERKWGDLNTFNEVEFKNHIDVDISEEFNFLGKQRQAASTALEAEICSYAGEHYFYSDKGWRGIQRVADHFRVAGHLIDYSMPNIDRYYFELRDLASSIMQVGDRAVPKYNLGNKTYIKIGEELYDQYNVLEVFQLPNSEFAVVFCNRGTAGSQAQRWDASELWFEKENGDKMLIGKSERSSFVLNDTLKVLTMELTGYAMSLEDIPWYMFTEFNLPANTMVIEFENDNVEVQWNDEGTKLNYKIMN
jgi:hypothetical protein